MLQNLVASFKTLLIKSLLGKFICFVLSLDFKVNQEQTNLELLSMLKYVPGTSLLDVNSKSNGNICYFIRKK